MSNLYRFGPASRATTHIHVVGRARIRDSIVPATPVEPNRASGAGLLPEFTKARLSLAIALAFLIAFTQIAALPSTAQAQTVWTAADSMGTARDTHTATLLRNGQVLVVGGRNSGGTLASAEIYNPATDIEDPTTSAWSATGSLNVARQGHSATVLTNGKVLVVGGRDASFTALDSAELYDPTTGQWSMTGSLGQARSDQIATMLVDGKVLVAGGRAGGLVALASAELYDPNTGQWSNTGSLVTGREGHESLLLSNGKVMVAGGTHYTGTPPSIQTLATVELYDPTTGAWSATDSLSVDRTGLSLTLLLNQKVLAAGGTQLNNTQRSVTTNAVSTAELYDPETGLWSLTGPMQHARSDHQALMMAYGDITAVSGLGQSGIPIASTEIYDWKTGVWSESVDLNVARWHFTLTPTASGNGELLIAGGEGAAFSAVDNAEIYDILSNIQPSTVEVTVPRLNIRSGPGTQFGIVARLYKGDLIEHRGRQDRFGAWIYVCCRAGVPKGWIRTSGLTLPIVSADVRAGIPRGLEVHAEVPVMVETDPMQSHSLFGPLHWHPVQAVIFLALVSSDSDVLSKVERVDNTPSRVDNTLNGWRKTTEFSVEHSYPNLAPIFTGCQAIGESDCLHTPTGPFVDARVEISTTGRSPRLFRDDDVVFAESAYTVTTTVVPFYSSEQSNSVVNAGFSATAPFVSTQRVEAHAFTRKPEWGLGLLNEMSLCYCVFNAFKASPIPTPDGYCDRYLPSDDDDIEGPLPNHSDPNVRKVDMPSNDFVLDMATYLNVRDYTLAETVAGRRYIDLYYEHTRELTLMMLREPEIEAEMTAVMEEAEPYLAALFNGDAGSMVISADQVISVTNLITTVSNAAGPELSALIEDELDRLPPPQNFVGKAVSEVITMLKNGGYDTPPAFSVSGTVADLAGSGLVLQNNGSDDLAINDDGGFTFPNPVVDGWTYAVTVKTHPSNPAQFCTINAGSGTIDDADVSNVAVTCVTGSSPSTHHVGGNVGGLAGVGLVLQNNFGDDRTIAANGSFTFTTALADESSFAVTVKRQPISPAQVCTVSNGTGSLSGADVRDATINCVTGGSSTTQSVGGTVSGLAGSGLVLQNNGGDDLAINANGGFTFANPIADGSTYAVTVKTHPDNPAQFCTITAGSGTMADADVSSVAVTCVTGGPPPTHNVGGAVSGLTGSGLVLQNNFGDDLAITGNGAFTFATALVNGSSYAVTVKSQPTGPNQACSVSNGTGSLSSADVTNVAIACATDGGSGGEGKAFFPLITR